MSAHTFLYAVCALLSAVYAVLAVVFDKGITEVAYYAIYSAIQICFARCGH